MEKCKHEFGCHNCQDALWQARQQIDQFLQEPAKELGRMREQMIALRKHIDNIVVLDYKEENK